MPSFSIQGGHTEKGQTQLHTVVWLLSTPFSIWTRGASPGKRTAGDALPLEREEGEELKPEGLRLSRPSSRRPGSSPEQRKPRVRAAQGTSTEDAPTEARRGSGESTPPGPGSGAAASTRRVGAASPGCSSLPEPCSNSPSAPASEFRAG